MRRYRLINFLMLALVFFTGASGNTKTRSMAG